jgi:hypothetical protein
MPPCPGWGPNRSGDRLIVAKNNGLAAAKGHKRETSGTRRRSSYGTLFLQGSRHLLGQLGNRNVHLATILLGAVVPNPPNLAILVNENEGVAGFTASSRPLHHIVGCGHLITRVREEGARHTGLLRFSCKVRNGVRGNRDDGDTKGTKAGVILQINDLLDTGLSARAHAEEEQHRLLAAVLLERNPLPASTLQFKGGRLVPYLQPLLLHESAAASREYEHSDGDHPDSR